MPKHAVDTIIFDFDGVVVDSGKDIANAANYMLQQFGMAPLPPSQIVSYIGGGAEPLVRRCLGERADELFAEALPLFKKRYGDYSFVETDLYPDAHGVLQTLHEAGKRMAIATNKLEPLTHLILKGLDIAPYFAVVVGPESVSNRKPDPEALHIILRHIPTPPERTLMIGDTAADILAGKAAGTVTCGVTYGFAPRAEIEAAEPDFIIDRLPELLDYIA